MVDRLKKSAATGLLAFSHPEVLVHGEIEIRIAWSIESVAARIPDAARSWAGEECSVKYTGWVS